MEPKYITKTDFNREEYERYAKAIMGDNWRKSRFFLALASLMLVVMALQFVKAGYYVSVILPIGLAVGLPIIIRILRTKRLEETYNQIIKYQGHTVTILFYEDQVETQNRSVRTICEYSKLYRVMETEMNFYIMAIPNSGVIVQKKNCSDELMDFIRKISPNYSKSN